MLQPLGAELLAVLRCWDPKGCVAPSGPFCPLTKLLSLPGHLRAWRGGDDSVLPNAAGYAR